MLEGALTFQVGDELAEVAAGEVAFAPRTVPHTFSNRDGGPARFVIVLTDAGFERHFARLAANRAGLEPPAWCSARCRRSSSPARNRRLGVGPEQVVQAGDGWLAADGWCRRRWL